MRLAVLSVACLALCCGEVRAAEGIGAQVKANDLYVSCYLLINDAPATATSPPAPYDPAWCGLASLYAIANREGRRQEKFSFCLPPTADPAIAMANAYMDFYEGAAKGLVGKEAGPAFAIAMNRKWPC